MRKKICSLILVLGFASLSLVMTSESAQSQVDSLVIGSLYPLPADTHAAVNVRLTPSRGLSALTIPLTFRNDSNLDITLDSIQWSDWFLANEAEFPLDSINNVDKFMFVAPIWFLGYLPVPSVHDTLFKMWFSTGPFWDHEVGVVIDTFRIVEPPLELVLLDTTISGAFRIVPGVRTGFLGPTGIRDVDFEDAGLPQELSLGQNYPNPFNPTTVIRFALPQDGRVQIEVFNILGQKIATLVDDYLTAGYKETGWDGKDSGGTDVASGVYFYRIRTDNFTDVKKMIFLK